MDRIKEIEKRLAEIVEEGKKDNADLDALTEERDDLVSERKTLVENAEKRQALINTVVNDENATVVRNFTPEKKEKEIRFNAESPEYRNAFLKKLLGEDLTD